MHFLLLVLSSAGRWTQRTNQASATPTPRWWWPRPTLSPWTARAGGRPYSAAPAWSTMLPGARVVFSEALTLQEAHGGLWPHPNRRCRRRAQWTEWGGDDRRRAWRETEGNTKVDEDMRNKDVIVLSIRPSLITSIMNTVAVNWPSHITVQSNRFSSGVNLSFCLRNDSYCIVSYVQCFSVLPLGGRSRFPRRGEGSVWQRSSLCQLISLFNDHVPNTSAWFLCFFELPCTHLSSV